MYYTPCMHLMLLTLGMGVPRMQRFIDLARGVDGVGYRAAAKIDGVSPVHAWPPDNPTMV